MICKFIVLYVHNNKLVIMLKRISVINFLLLLIMLIRGFSMTYPMFTIVTLKFKSSV